MYKFEVPLAVKPSQLELDVSVRRIQLKYANVYNLDLSIPYPINDKKGNAKYDKSNKTLTVTLPLLPWVDSSSDEKNALETSGVVEINPSTHSTTLTEPDNKPHSTDNETKSDTSAAATTTANTSSKTISKNNKDADANARWIAKEDATKLSEESKQIKEEIETKRLEALQNAQKIAAESKVSNLEPKTSSTDSNSIKDNLIQTQDNLVCFYSFYLFFNAFFLRVALKLTCMNIIL